MKTKNKTFILSWKEAIIIILLAVLSVATYLLVIKGFFALLVWFFIEEKKDLSLFLNELVLAIILCVFISFLILIEFSPGGLKSFWRNKKKRR